MFRPLRRKVNAVSEETARALLKKERRAVFAVNGDDGYPYAIPVNYYYDEEAGKIYFHGAKVGHKMDSIKKDDKCCFTVYGNEMHKEGEWAAYVQSTVVFGRCHVIEDRDEALAKIRIFAAKYYPTVEEMEEVIASDFHGAAMYEIDIEHMCGKQIQER